MLQFIDTVIGIIWCIMHDELEHVLTQFVSPVTSTACNLDKWEGGIDPNWFSWSVGSRLFLFLYKCSIKNLTHGSNPA